MKFYEPTISLEVYNEAEDLTYVYSATFLQVVSTKGSNFCSLIYHLTVTVKDATLDIPSLFPFYDKMVQLTFEEYKELVEEPILLVSILQDGKFPLR